MRAQARGLGHLRSLMLIAGFAVIAAVGCDSTSDYPLPTVTLPPTTATPTDPTPAPATSMTSEVAIRETVIVRPGDDLAALVAQSEPGTSFVFPAGVHRQGPIVAKDDMTFSGEPGAVLSGSVVMGEFSTDGDRWWIDGVDLSADTGGECFGGYLSCGMPNDLFIDDVMVWRVDTETEVTSGTWWGGNGRIVVGDDPTDRVVELSVRSHAIVGSASNVTLRDLVVEKFAVPSQDGAINAQEPNDGALGENWLIENVEIRFNHAAGLRTGNGTRVVNVSSHDNGQLGIAVSSGRNVLITDSELAHNNVRGYLWEWEGGGGKFR